MIQRKQTIFLFLAAVAMFLDFIFPIADFIGDGDYQLRFYIYQVVSLVPDVTLPFDTMFVAPVTALTALVILGSLITIFIYKRRIMQAKLVRGLVIFTLGDVALLFFYNIPALEELSGIRAEYNYAGIAMPLVAMIFLTLAIKGILKDEQLVRSADRLR
jgi:hypothetical protein